MAESAAYNAALAIAVGLAAYSIATRLMVPSIVLLLAAGVLIGPDGFGLLSPTAFGSGALDLVTLAVMIILFEGGLGLRLEDLRQQRRALLLLLTVGGATSMVVGMLAARLVLDFPWSTAALYGALVIVTGPTVVTPLMSRLTVSRPVRELLISEGVLIDPLGAIVGLVILEYIVGEHGAWGAGAAVVARLGIGAVVGAAAGIAVTVALRRRWIPLELWNPAVLAAALITGTLASRLSPEAGLMAVVAQGMVMANNGLHEMQRLRRFNEEITVVLLGFLFVLLAANLPLAAVAALGWPAVLVVACVAWVARPLAVAVCTIGSVLSPGERAFVAWICPRGIVAASVAGLFRIRLDEAGLAGGTQLEALIFITVALTVTVQGLSAGRMARALRIDVDAIRGTLIIGADAVGRLLARVLAAWERQVALLDRSAGLCRLAVRDGLTVYQGDALSPETLEDAGARYADTVLAATGNVELNTLIAVTVRRQFRVPRVLAVDEPARRPGTDHPFPGSFPGLEEMNRALRLRTVHLEHRAVDASLAGTRVLDLSYGPSEFALLRVDVEGRAFVASAEQRLAAGETLVCARIGEEPSGLDKIVGLRRMVAADAPPRGDD